MEGGDPPTILCGMVSRISPASRLLLVPPPLLIVLLWSAIAALNIALSLADPVEWAVTIKVAITSLCGILLSLIVSAATGRIVVAKTRSALPLLAALVMLSGSALWMIDVVVQSRTSWSGLADDWSAAMFLVRRYNWVYFTVLFSLQAAVSALLTSARALQSRERQLIEAQLAALRFQLNPHFLFNTLNAISTLVAEAGAEQALEMITRLSDFLRISLTTTPSDLVSLDTELEMIQAYLDIEAVRFGDRLAVHYACGPDLGDAEVPSLILQPLVENAVKYAVAPSKETVLVTIEAHREDGELVLKVLDNGCTPPDRAGRPGTGVGLRNVAARLEALYGAAGRLETSRRDDGFQAVVRMPLARAQDGGEV